MRIWSLAVTAAMIAATQPLAAATFSYEQSGWFDATLTPQPGTLSFSFTGDDSNGDTFLTYGFPGSPNEVTAFSIAWSGNTVVPAFSHAAIGNLLALLFPLGTLSFGGSNSLILSFDAVNFTLSGGGLSGGCTGATVCGYLASPSGALISVTTPTAVPEPVGLGLLGIALAGLVGVARRRT